MKAIFEIIPRSNNWHKFWIFVAGCATGAAGAIGAILIKERTEVRDGCVIFRHEARTEEESSAQEATFTPENMNKKGEQGDRTEEAEAGQVPGDAKGHSPDRE